MLVAEFRKPPMTIKMVQEIACGPENSSESCLCHVNLRGFFLHPIRGRHWRKSTNEKPGNLNENFDATFGTTLELVSIFIEASKMLYL